MKVKINGKWTKRPLRAGTVGYRAEGIRLNGSDLKELSQMSDPQLAATVRQLSARVNRAPYPQPETIDESWFQKRGYPTGGTVTGRVKRDPEFIVPSFFGKTKPQPHPTQIKRHALLGVDFSDIERRVMAMYMAPSQFGKTDAFAWMIPSGFSATVKEMALEAVQDRIDEEGCGAFMAAAREYEKD